MQSERSPVGEGDVEGLHRIHLVTVPLELEVSQDRGGHQAHHVGQGRNLEVRAPGHVGRSRSARLVTPFEHDRLESGPRQVCGRGKDRCDRRRSQGRRRCPRLMPP